MRRFLVTGGQGQLGTELRRLAWPAGIEIVAPSRSVLNISDLDCVRRCFAGNAFDAVINAAAYTAVDAAESDSAAAFAANATGPAHLAEATRAADIPLVHISTDYVFDGSKPDAYVESDPVHPLGVYGASKEAGERAVCLGNPRSVVIRTAWVVSPHGRNFVKTMLRAGAERSVLRVVNDQRGCPTSASDLAQVVQAITLRLVDEPAAPTGIFHCVNGGETTWFGLARHIFAISAPLGGPAPLVEAIATSEYPTPARRPANSRLSTARLARDYGIITRPWRQAVEDVVTSLLTAVEAERGY